MGAERPKWGRRHGKAARPIEPGFTYPVGGKKRSMPRNTSYRAWTSLLGLSCACLVE